MTIGNDLWGGAEWGSTYGATAGSSAAAAPLVVDPAPDIFYPDALLHFFDIEASNGDHLRVVNFADPKAATLGEITFDGAQWQSLQLAQPEYETDTTRLSHQVFAVADPTRTLLSWVNAHDRLRTGKVTATLIKHADLGTPANAIFQRVFRFKHITPLEGPARLQFVIGTPNLLDLGFPYVSLNRFGCHHVFERRHTHNSRTLCHYPSEEFAAQTFQFLSGAPSDNPEQLRFGLWTVNGSTGWKVGGQTQFDLANVLSEAVDQDGLKLENDATMRFHDTNTEAQYIYKRILAQADSSTDIDVSARLLFKKDTNTQQNQLTGIIVVSEDDPTDWVIFGIRQLADGPSVNFGLRRRATTNGSSTDVDVTGSAVDAPAGANYDEDNAIRVKRVGSAWTFYSRAEDVSKEFDESDSWAQHASQNLTWDPAGNLRVGLINCWGESTTDLASVQFEGYASHLRFTAGGFTICNRSKRHCLARENIHQRSGYEGMPDAAVRF